MFRYNKAMTQIILLRHGLVHNPQKIIYGALPGFGLDKAGLADIDAVAERLAQYPITAIFTSPLQRAVETIERIRQQPTLAALPVTTDERLREWVFVSEGLTYPQVTERYPELLEQYQTDPTKLPGVIDGKRYETFAELEERVGECADELLISFTNQTILLVSHGDPIIMALAHYLQKPFWSVKEAEYPRPAETRTLHFTDTTVTVSEWPEKL